MTQTIFLVIIGILVLFLMVSIYYNIKHALIIIKLQDGIEDALDILDERYASIAKILEIPLFYDSREIRQVITDIGECQKAILQAANDLVRIDTDADETKENN